jgi:hypothetical protein
MTPNEKDFFARLKELLEEHACSIRPIVTPDSEHVEIGFVDQKASRGGVVYANRYRVPWLNGETDHVVLQQQVRI